MKCIQHAKQQNTQNYLGNVTESAEPWMDSKCSSHQAVGENPESGTGLEKCICL